MPSFIKVRIFATQIIILSLFMDVFAHYTNEPAQNLSVWNQNTPVFKANTAVICANNSPNKKVFASKSSMPQGTAYIVRAWTFSASAQLSAAARIFYLKRNNGHFCNARSCC